jgi:Vitamin K-dependent gamma-carboxylase
LPNTPKTRSETARGVAERLFALDTRSLALFRIALGLLVVFDAVGRMPDLTAHYTDAGAVPRAVIDELRGGDVPLSLYLLDGSALFAGSLLALHAVAGACMVVGYRTRWATAAAWLLTFSLHHRNLLVANFGDLIQRLLLFWSLFLPLGERASLDRRSDAAKDPAPNRFLGWGSAGFIVQLLSIYFFSALHKTGSTWHDGSAVAVSLSNDSLAKLPQAAIALGYPQLLVLLTHAVRYFEMIGPLLMLVPVATTPLRIALVLAFWSFHLGLFAFLELGTFSFVCIAAWCALIPGAIWDRLGVPAGPGPPVLRRRQWPAAIFTVLVLLANVTTLRMDLPFPPLLGLSLRLTGLYQSWDMFSPDPAPDDGWILVVGRRGDGGEEDLLHGGPVSWAKPAEVSSTFPNFRWANYMRALRHRRPPVRHAFAEYMCRRTNADRRGAAQIEAVTIFYLEDVERTSTAPPRVGHVELWKEGCAPESAR